MNKQLLTALPLIALAGLSQASAKSKKSDKVKFDKPNVIFIYADDMGKGMMSVYGQKYLKTPNMDKLINQGISFSNAYGCHYSAPARASLLTGYSDVHKGHWNNVGGGTLECADTSDIAPIEARIDAKNVRLAKGDEYLPEIFKKAGYVTGQIGKLEYSFASTRKEVKSHGWDYFYGYMDHQMCHGFYPPYLYENDEIVMIEGNTRTDCGKAPYPYDTEESVSDRWNMEGKAQYSQDLFDAKIKDFMTENKDKPFFLYHPTQLPHGPVGVPYIHEDVKKMHFLNQVEKEYATMVLLLDESIGKILDEVKELGLEDNTLIIFSNDNGHEIYTESTGRTETAFEVATGKPIDNYYLRYNSQVAGDIFNGNMGMTGKKRSNLEGGLNVPLSYYWPGKLEPKVLDEVISNYDLIATMADMLDVSINPNKTARSYFQLINGEASELPEDRFVIADSYEGPSLIMNNGWKLRYCNVSKKYELYNIRQDFRELTDLANLYPERVEEMRQIMIKNVQTSDARGGYKR